MKALAVVAAISTLMAGASATANPAWKKELTSTQAGEHPALPTGTMEFELSWKGILRSGELKMEFGRPGAHKKNIRIVESQAESLGIASGFFPYKGNSWSELNPNTFETRLFSAWERNKDETVKTESKFSRKGVECREETRPNGQHTPQIDEHKFPYPCFDIGSAILHIRSQKLNKGDQITLLIHPFNNPYLLRTQVIGREVHDGRNAIHLSVTMQKIDRETLKLRPYKKLKRPASLWLSDDNDRIPLELRAQIFIGDIRATLSRFRRG